MRLHAVKTLPAATTDQILLDGEFDALDDVLHADRLLQSRGPEDAAEDAPEVPWSDAAWPDL